MEAEYLSSVFSAGQAAVESGEFKNKSEDVGRAISRAIFYRDVINLISELRSERHNTNSLNV